MGPALPFYLRSLLVHDGRVVDGSGEAYVKRGPASAGALYVATGGAGDAAIATHLVHRRLAVAGAVVLDFHAARLEGALGTADGRRLDSFRIFKDQRPLPTPPSLPTASCGQSP